MSGLSYIATATLRDGSLEKYLRAAAAGTSHIGHARSRGFGSVEIGVSAIEGPAAEPSTEVVEGDLRLQIEIESPTHIGEALPGDAFVDTRLEVPGSAIRGMLGFAIAGALHDPDGHEVFQRTVAGDGSDRDGAIFDFFWPVDGGDPQDDARPWPLTLHACHTHPAVRRDTLFDRLRLKAGQDVERATCERCGAVLKRTRMGGPRLRRAPSTLVVTRTALNRRIAGVRNEALFSHRLLAPGTRFEGTIRRIPDGGHALLHDALNTPLALGRGRGRGWGRVRVVGGGDAPSPMPLTDRAAMFGEALERNVDGQAMDRWLPVTLLSPLLLEDTDEAAVLRRIPNDAILLKARRFGIERGWSKNPRESEDPRKKCGPRRAIQSVLAGGVYVLRLPTAPDHAALAAIERDGLGARTFQGFGRVRFYDPIHLEHC